MTEDLSITGCTTSPPGANARRNVVAHVADYDAWSSTTPKLQVSCADFEKGTTFSESSVTTSGKMTWNGYPSRKSSRFTFEGFAVSSPLGTDMFSFPTAGGSATVSGSYPGTATAMLIANPNLSFTGECTTIAGVTSIDIQGGSVTFGQASS